MKISATNVILVVAAAVAAGWSSFVSNFHPGVTVIAIGGFVVSVLSQLAQSPIVTGVTPVSATTATEAKPAVTPSPDLAPKLGMAFIKDNRNNRGFSATDIVASLALIFTVLAAYACTQAAKNAENAVLSLEQFACAQEKIDQLGGQAVAADIAVACNIVQPFIPVIQSLINTQSATSSHRLDASCDAK